MNKTYAVATANRDFASSSAKDAARVAAAWSRRGFAPVAQVIFSADTAPVLRFSEPVEVTTVRATTAALTAATPRNG